MSTPTYPHDVTPSIDPVVGSAAPVGIGTSDRDVAPPTLSPNQTDTCQAVDQRLEELDRLAAQLCVGDDYVVEPLDFELPEPFCLSVVIPVFNERDTIRQIVAHVRAIPIPLEIIIVDDKSTDGTAEVLRELMTLPDVKVVFKPENEGKGAALRTGFQLTTGQVVVVQDADLEYDPRDIPGLVRPIVEGESEVVYGSRFAGNQAKGSSLVHRLGNRCLTLLSNLFTGYCLTDMETCYKVFRREVLAGIPLCQNRFGFEPEFTAKLARRGYEIVERPIRYDARDWEEGKKIGLRDLAEAIYCISRYGFRD